MSTPTESPTPSEKPSLRAQIFTPKNLLIGTVLLIAILLMNWRIPTRVQATITVDRAEFTVSHAPSSRILDAVSFHSLHVENFESLSFQPAILQVADPRQYNFESDTFPESAWTSLLLDGEVEVVPIKEGESLSVTFEQSPSSSSGSRRLDPIWVEEGSVIILERPPQASHSLSIKTVGPSQRATFTFSDTIDMIVDGGLLKGAASPHFAPTDSMTYRIRLASTHPSVVITGGQQPLTLTFSSDAQSLEHFFSEGAIPVSAIAFTHQNEMGNHATALTAPGTLSFPDFPDMDSAVIKPPDFIGFDDLRTFSIKTIQWDDDHQGLRFELDGIVGHIRSGQEQLATDHRLTQFDALWHNPRIRQLFTIGQEVAGG